MYNSIQKFFFPVYFKYLIIKNNSQHIVILKSKKFFFILKFNKRKLKFNKNTRSILIKSNFIQKKENINFVQYLIKKIIRSWEVYFYKKFKFKSKGLKIKRKRRKILKFFFWLSHVNLAILKNIKIKRIGKQKYIFIGANWIFLTKICKKMRLVRPNNLFTKKGIRFGRQIVLKKRGKKVTFI